MTVFGAKGIRALMIEAALPDLNNEANKLLGKMTDGLMTLEVSAQKENKDGSVAEALNIKIYQNGMDRDYASYSGGERFRIDLALRIAMSRLMTNRIGAPMQTLIIDEGFGTQDENGIDKVIYAINSIKDDFRLIMVIIKERLARPSASVRAPRRPSASAIHTSEATASAKSLPPRTPTRAFISFSLPPTIPIC